MAKFLSISANILLFGKSHFCLYLSQISMDLNSVKKDHFASVLPQLLCTHLTSSFNIRKVQIWPPTFPLCIVINECCCRSIFVVVGDVGALYHCVKSNNSIFNVYTGPSVVHQCLCGDNMTIVTESILQCFFSNVTPRLPCL